MQAALTLSAIRPVASSSVIENETMAAFGCWCCRIGLEFIRSGQHRTHWGHRYFLL